MGNTQSAPSPREQYRLSKPKTSASSSNLLALACQQTDPNTSSTPSKSTINGETEAVVTSQSGERRSRQDARPKLRSHLFGSAKDSARTEPSQEDCDRRCGIGELVSGVKDRILRPCSYNSEILSARGSSINLTGSGGASRLTLVPESAVPQFDEATRILEEIRARASTDELAAFHHMPSPVDESAPNELFLSPIRRRSLLTPGIATRIPDDILRKPPPREKLQSQLDRAYYYNPDLSDSSPLARLAVLDLADHGRISPVTRTGTPTFHDYGHLGGLKLGTLRITNRTASPTPSDNSMALNASPPRPDLNKDGDYFTLSGRSRIQCGDGSNVLERSQWKSGSSLPLRDCPESHPERASELDGTSISPISGDTTKIQSSSQWKQESLLADVTSDGGISTEPVPPIPWKKQRPMSLFDFSHDKADTASSMAQEYITELPHSPFSNAGSYGQGSPKLLTTSKANEIEDNLLEGGGIVLCTQKLSPKEEDWETNFRDASTGDDKGGSREEALRILDGRASSTSGQGSRRTSSSRSSADYAEVASYSSQQSGKPVSKADSGYSSNVSLRSLDQEQQVGNEAARKMHDRTTTLLLRPCLSAPKTAPVPRLDSTSVIPTVKIVPVDQTYSACTPSSVEGHNAIRESDIYVPPLLEDSAKPNALRSASSTVSTTPGKLRKGRPLSQPLPVNYITVQGYRELSQSHIPPVPSNVAAQHAQRLHAFPLLEHTFPSLQHTNVGGESTNMSPISVPVRFPSPTKALDTVPSVVKQPSQGASTKTCGNLDDGPRRQRGSINWKISHRRSSRERPSRQDEACETIADFGTVTQSLGRSPYDIARPTLPWEDGLRDDHAIAHSVPMSFVGRPKITGMDEEEAARFARSRSKTRSQGTLRSRTSSTSSFNDRGGIPGKNIRPKSMIVDAPPVPALPGTDQVEKKGPGNTTSKPGLPASDTRPNPPSIVVSAVPDTPMSTDNHPAVSKYDESWESHRRTWLQRRRSAAEALLARGETSQNEETPTIPAERKPAATSARAFTPIKPAMVAARDDSGVFEQERARSQPASRRAPSNLKPYGDDAGIVKPSLDDLAGRYTGGLAYGYEPGYGLGGSAGTRNTKTAASRKSVDVSRGFGIDLSDVPIFVARTIDC
ncbi:hypothetical protein MMC16_006099 [Acarospora aff. strigata]|nr:hypothetical protein [Acarospora aff. strigata]